MFDTSSIPAPIKSIVNRITQAGGKALLVGGAVIDIVQSQSPKDWDLEVFGLDYSDLERIFADLHPKTVGKAFGVLKISVGDHPDVIDVDLNVPRMDNKIGIGHQGFSIVVDHNMSPKEAALRRDFTINSMSVDLTTGELIDCFGGMKDLSDGVLRATDPVLFVQDPLRGLRAMQLLARKAKTVDPETMTLIKSMSNSFPELPKERILEEFRKLFLKAPKPSVGLNFLRDSTWIDHFPEIKALIGCEQREEWHAEGDVWVHSCLAADAMAQIRHLVPEHQREAFAFGVFLHDVGKPISTITRQMVADRHPMALVAAERACKPVDDMWLTAHGHDEAGKDPAESFMRRMTDSTKTINLVRGIVGHHMQPGHLAASDAGKGAYARLHRKMVECGGNLRLIGQMCQCDSCASGPDARDGKRSLASGEPNWENRSSNMIASFAEQFENEPEAVLPKVLGRDLIALGMKPGPALGKMVKQAMELQESNADLTKEEIIARLGMNS